MYADGFNVPNFLTAELADQFPMLSKRAFIWKGRLMRVYVEKREHMAYIPRIKTDVFPEMHI